VLSGAPAPSRVPSRPGRLHCHGRLVRRPFVAMVAAGGYGGNKQDVAWLRVTVFVGVFCYLLREINVDLQHLQRFSISKILNWRFTWDLSITSRWSHILLWPSSETLQPKDKRLGNTGWITRVHGGCTSHGCTVNIDEHRWTSMKNIEEPHLDPGLWARVFRREGYLCCLASPEFHRQNTKILLNCELLDSVMPIQLNSSENCPWTLVLDLLLSYCSDV